jgi:hypothetical protein
MNRLQIGTHNLKQLCDHYRKHLFDEYLPFWKRHGVDHERGASTGSRLTAVSGPTVILSIRRRETAR